MAGAVELATAYIALVPSLKGASQKISDELNPAAATAGASAGDGLGRSIIGTAAKWAAPLAAAVGFGSILKTGFDEAKDAAAGTAQLAAGITSTGNAANVSVDGLNSLASSIQDYSGQTDDSIVKSEQLLLTFTNIKNNGPDKIFDQATKASADMAAKFGGDASQQAVLLGKALNDPVKGITALQRVGVSFTDSQKNTIAALVKTGDVAGAQKVILGELNTEFGGAAKAAGESFPGQLQRLHRAFEDLSQGIVQGFLPVLGPPIEGAIKLMKLITPAIGGAAQAVSDKAALIGGALGAVFELLKTGQFTGGLREALGLEEDSKIVGGILNVRTAFSDFFTGFHKGVDDIGSNQSALAHWGAATFGVFAKAKTSVKDFHDGFTKGVDDVGSNQSSLAHWGAAVLGVFATAKTGIQTFFDGLKTGSNDAGGGLIGTMSGIGNMIHGLVVAAGPAFASLAATFGPLIPQVVSLASAFSPVQLIFKSIEPMLPQLLGVFVQLASVIGGTLSTALVTLLPVFMQLQGVFVSVFQQVLAVALPVIVQLVTMLGQTFAQLIPIVVPIITQVATLAMTLVSQLAPILMQLITAVMPMVVTIFGALLTAIGPVISMIAGLLIPIIQALLPVVSVVFRVIADIITAAMQIVMGIIQVVTGIISGNWAQVWSGMLNILGGVFALIISVISGAIQLVISVISAGLGVVTNVFFAIWSGIIGYVSTAFSSIVNGASGMLNDLVGFFGGIGGRVIGALGNIGSTLFSSGQALIQGFIDGIKGMVGAIGDAVGGVMDFAKQFFPHSPAKRGPFSGSGYTSFSGQALAKDFAKGIASQNDVVADAAAGIMTSASLTGHVGISSALQNNPAGRAGATFNTTINQVDDPIGTAHAVTRRQLALSS